MRRVRVVLEYLHPWPNAAGFYSAVAGGEYQDLGLDVEVSVFDPLRGDSLEYLARGETDFAVFPGNRLLARRALGEPLVGIAAINHRALETIQTISSAGIGRPRDLAGRRVAFNPTPRGVAMVRHLVRIDGGDPDAIVVVDTGVRELSVDDLAAGKADATFGGYWAWDALFGTVPADRRITWPVDEIGAPAYHGYLLGTQETTVERDPDLVRAFLSATEQGYLAAAADQQRTLAVLERVIAYFPAEVLARSLSLIAPTWTHDGRWGEQRDELLGPYAAWLAEHDVIPSADLWIGATTNGLLPRTIA